MTGHAIDHDWLVRKAEDLVQRLKQSGWQGSDQGKTQASKAIEVAQDASSLRLFVNWLRYQAAREREKKQPGFWSRSLDGQLLAEAMVADLQEIQQQFGKDRTMQGVRLYLGYFRRALVGIRYLDRIQL
ncbi:MAG: hypothetical protein D6759_05910 [Chloroflexi bacterium]|nr:MAG: hypothetical protein D6759_05910 [Chloroflexota bacterium]